MAAFKQHIMFSSLIGAGCTVALGQLGFEWTHAGLAGALCAVSGMLPDLDSASGKPVHELFGVIGAVSPLLLLQRLHQSQLSTEGIILVLAGVYLFIRFGAAWLFKHLTVHRGMFHSIPAAVIAAEIVYLAHDSVDRHGRYGNVLLAGGVLIGYLSHLLLDEAYSVDAQGLRIHLNKSAGSALKLFSRSIPATLVCWLFLTGLTYLVGIKLGYVPPINQLPYVNRLAAAVSP